MGTKEGRIIPKWKEKNDRRGHFITFGLIQQLPIPPRPWHLISFNLIEHLPASNGHTAILNVVDWASKQLISIPTSDKVTAPKIAKLFLHHVFAKHSVPLHVTCNRGSEFTSQFFQSLGKLLDINLHFTSLCGYWDQCTDLVGDWLRELVLPAQGPS